jgi:hypothetical protein
MSNQRTALHLGARHKRLSANNFLPLSFAPGNLAPRRNRLLKRIV